MQAPHTISIVHFSFIVYMTFLVRRSHHFQRQSCVSNSTTRDLELSGQTFPCGAANVLAHTCLPLRNIAGLSHFFRVNPRTLVLDGPEIVCVIRKSMLAESVLTKFLLYYFIIQKKFHPRKTITTSPLWRELKRNEKSRPKWPTDRPTHEFSSGWCANDYRQIRCNESHSWFDIVINSLFTVSQIDRLWKNTHKTHFTFNSEQFAANTWSDSPAKITFANQSTTWLT